MGSTNGEWDNGPVDEMRIRSVNADEGVLGEFCESIAGNSVRFWRLDDAPPLRPATAGVKLSGYGQFGNVAPQGVHGPAPSRHKTKKTVNQRDTEEDVQT